MKSDSRRWLSVALGLSLASAGCGGGSKPPAAAPPAPVVNVPIQPIQAVNPRAATTPADVATSEEDGEPVLPGPDDFEISSDQIITEVDREFQEPPPAPVEVVALAPGLDSSTLEIAADDGADAANAGVKPVNPNIPELAKPPVNNVATKSANKAASKTGSTGKKKEDEKEAPPPTAAGWQLPAGVTEVAGSGTDPETGLPWKITVGRDPVEMVLIPPGVFLEGVDGRDPQAAPQHAVLLEGPYYIDVVEVTVARHDAFREFFRKSEGRRIDGATNHDGNPENPAVGIKFLDAKFYAKWTGKELPTEAQWERAARGSQGFSYPWGNGRPIWPQSRQPGQLDPVATFSGDLSPYGVYDMAGNAREWCLDLYSAEAYRQDVAAGGSAVRNPTGPKTIPGGGKVMVVKGGKTDWAVWRRAGQPQNEAAPDLGFRCVLNIAAASTDGDKSTKKSSEKKKKPEAF